MKKVKDFKNFNRWKKYKDLVIYFTGYVPNKSIKTLRLHYDESIGKIEGHEGNKHLIIDDLCEIQY